MRSSLAPYRSGVLLVALLSAGLAWGQAAPKTSTLGGTASATSKLLTREELRDCMNRQKDMNARIAELDAQKVPLEAEKQAIVQDQAALKAHRTKLDVQPEIAAINARTQALSDRVTAWNERVKAFNETPNRSGSAAERQRTELNKEQVELEAQRVALESDRSAVTDRAQSTVAAFNARAVALDQKVTDWNARNEKHAQRATTLSDERQVWTSECANRRYREDDETAIRRGL